MAPATLSPDGRTITVTVPIRLRRRAGRKTVIAPDGASSWAPRPRVDNTLVKAVARAHRWQQLMESGRYSTMTELAAAEKVDQCYMARVLRLILLAPDVIEAILDGRQIRELALAELMQPFPVEWDLQYMQFGQRRL